MFALVLCVCVFVCVCIRIVCLLCVYVHLYCVRVCVVCVHVFVLCVCMCKCIAMCVCIDCMCACVCAFVLCCVCVCAHVYDACICDMASQPWQQVSSTFGLSVFVWDAGPHCESERNKMHKGTKEACLERLSYGDLKVWLLHIDGGQAFKEEGVVFNLLP